MKQKIINQFGTLANACKELDIAYRTLRKLYNGDASEKTLRKIKTRIKGAGYNPRTFKPL